MYNKGWAKTDILSDWLESYLLFSWTNTYMILKPLTGRGRKLTSPKNTIE
jgi:hypothetical protein